MFVRNPSPSPAPASQDPRCRVPRPARRDPGLVAQHDLICREAAPCHAHCFTAPAPQTQRWQCPRQLAGILHANSSLRWIKDKIWPGRFAIGCAQQKLLTLCRTRQLDEHTKKSSRKVVVDSVEYRWRVRGRPDVRPGARCSTHAANRTDVARLPLARRR